MVVFTKSRIIVSRCLQLPQKVARTPLLTFLTCFWTLWRLWRLPTSYFLISRGLRTSERSHGQATPGSPNHGFSWIFENFQKIKIFQESWGLSWSSSAGVSGAREIKKYDAERRHRRPRVQKQVRNVSSDVPTTLYGDWETLARISWKITKKIFFF